MEMKQFSEIESDLVQAESAAVKVLVCTESISQTVRATHFSSAFRPLAIRRPLFRGTDDRSKTDRQAAVQARDPCPIERVKARPQVPLLDPVFDRRPPPQLPMALASVPKTLTPT